MQIESLRQQYELREERPHLDAIYYLLYKNAEKGGAHLRRASKN